MIEDSEDSEVEEITPDGQITCPKDRRKVLKANKEIKADPINHLKVNIFCTSRNCPATLSTCQKLTVPTL